MTRAGSASPPPATRARRNIAYFREVLLDVALRIHGGEVRRQDRGACLLDDEVDLDRLDTTTAGDHPTGKCSEHDERCGTADRDGDGMGMLVKGHG